MSDNDKHDGLKGLADKAQDMVGGMVGMASASTAGSHDARAFVMNGCVSDRYEIEAAAVALRRSRSDSVRAFAQMMAEHHTTAMHQMASALRSHEVRDPLPDIAPTAELDARRQGMIQHLLDAPDDDFDRMYLDQQKLAHQEAIALHRGYAEHGDNPQLRSVALGGLPMVERHAAALKRINLH